MCVCMYVRVCVCVCMYVCMCANMYLNMCVNIKRQRYAENHYIQIVKFIITEKSS
jgi:hypothetical protein